MGAWEQYEKQKISFYQTIEEANEEHKNTKRLYCREEGKTDYQTRYETNASIKASIHRIHQDLLDANLILGKLLGNIKKSELDIEVGNLFNMKSQLIYASVLGRQY